MIGVCCLHRSKMMSRIQVSHMRVQGSARVIQCLQNGRSSLSFECRAALFDQEQVIRIKLWDIIPHHLLDYRSPLLFLLLFLREQGYRPGQSMEGQTSVDTGDGGGH